jgi:DNA processing protein
MVRGVLPAAGIAVIGARDASTDACAFAAKLVAALGGPLVSGLARGIDAAAHHAALAAGLPQVAYLGTGIARTFPPEHRALAEAIVAGGGALASELPDDAEATDETLRLRDRLQAAHASAVVLVETGLAGGAMHTLAFARALGRPRFALDAAASGNRRALADGAVPIPWDVAAAARRIRTP